jgi:hypothetical protein
LGFGVLWYKVWSLEVYSLGFLVKVVGLRFFS